MRRWGTTVLAAVLSAVVASTAAADTLRILTYNVGLLHVLGSDYVPLVKEREKLVPAEVARLARDESLDVILLQEVWRAGQAREIVAALSPLGYSAARPPVKSLLCLSSGLLLLVRSPLAIEEWSFRRFRKNTLIESVSRKGVLEAVVRDAQGRRIAVVGTHTVALDTRDGEPVDPKQLAAFLAQSAQIAEALERRSEHGAVPAVLLGDFNVGPGYAEKAYRTIADITGLVEAGGAAAPGDSLVSWDPENPLVKYGRYPDEPPAKIDHVFLRGDTGRGWKVLSARLVMRDPVEGLVLPVRGSAQGVASPLSDHWGFLVEAELTGS